MVKFLGGTMPWGLLCYFKITVYTCISPSVRRWFGNYLYFSRATMSIQGLVFSHSYINHAVVSVLVTYLTGDDDSNASLPIAAIITNMQEGLSETMVIVLAHISDKYTGCFKMIFFTNAAYFVGMLLLLLGGITGNRNMLYGAAILISLGEAGRSATLIEFLRHQYDLKQQKGREDTNEKQHKTRKEALWSMPWFLGAVAAVILQVVGLNWEKIFIFSIIILGVSTLWFCFGRFYNYFKSYNNSTVEQEQVEELEELGTVGELTNVHVEKQRGEEQAEGEKFWSFRTLRQLPKKVIKNIPMCLIFVFCSMIDVQQADIGEDEDEQGGELGRHTEVGTSPAEQATEGEKFWTLKKLKEEKHFLKIFAFCSTFLAFSIVLAAGSTFFFEQQSDLDHLPNNSAVYFSALGSLSRYITSYLCWLLIRKKWRHANVVRIGCGMACSILCCISARQIEKHRLSVVQKDNQLSTFWLVPQFVLLGLMGGLAEDGLINVIADQARADKLVERYASHICDFVLGIGKLVTALIVFALSRRWLVAKTNEKEKIGSWFKEDINASRLDKYYLFLTFLSLANLFYYVFIAFFHLYSKDISDKSVNEENKEKTKDVPATGG